MRFVWLSCDKRKYSRVGQSAAGMGPDAVFLLGDYPYIGDAAQTLHGVTTGDTGGAEPVDATIRLEYDQTMANPGYTALLANSDVYLMRDDHEWLGNDWDGSTANAESGGVSRLGSGTLTTDDVYAHHLEADAAFAYAVSTYADNPANSDEDADPELSANLTGATGADAADFPVRYFRVAYDANGNVVTDLSDAVVEFYILDVCNYRDDIDDTDNASKTMLGANQKAWLKTQILTAETAGVPFKVINWSKPTYRDGAGNTDGWSVYSTERDELLTYFDSNSITGVVGLAGDQHHPHVITQNAVDDTYDHMCVVAAPADQQINMDGATVGGAIKWLLPAPDDTPGWNVYGYGEITQDKCRIEIRRGARNNVLWSGEVLAGSSLVTYPAQKVA